MAVRKIKLMHELFGKGPDASCKGCSNILRIRWHDKSYRKCSVYGTTHSDATDWCVSYPACGMYCKEYTGANVVRLVHPDKKEDLPIDGQLTMFGWSINET